MSEKHLYFHIHGDNIVECERTLYLIEQALKDYHPILSGPLGAPTNPRFKFQFEGNDATLEFVFFPGFGRWNEDIRRLIRDRGGIIREAADVILSDVTSGQENPLVGIEYSGALAAGNQAWQRSGRAYSFGLAHVPFLYVGEIGGYELDAQRSRRSPRFPNPAIPFSYLSFSLSVDVPILPVFVENPGADEDSRTYYESVFGEINLVQFIRAIILDEDTTEVNESIEKKGIEFVRLLASKSRRNRTLTPEQWSDSYNEIKDAKGNSLVSYLLRETALGWSKTAYIADLTDTAKELMTIASDLSIGLTSSNLPMCLIPPTNRAQFADDVSNLYSDIDDRFLRWLGREEPLAICWVMGFKPRGDDARPDRGLPPLTRMLIGPQIELMTVVYGPAPPAHWPTLLSNPGNLGVQNGLWETILAASDAILVDSATDEITSHGFLSSHWGNSVNSSRSSPMLVVPIPERISEHDVDTVIHTLFTRMGSNQVFEGLCNPPGGDWSGISLLTENQSKELRWLSLPRVSGPQAKRPDHVLQIFGIRDIPVIFTVESKETATSVERLIGPRLKAYMEYLLSFPASTERISNENAHWQHSDLTLNPSSFLLASGVGFLIKGTSDLNNVREKADADLVIGLQFSEDKIDCAIRLVPCTNMGQAIANFIENIPIGNIGLSVQRHQ